MRLKLGAAKRANLAKATTYLHTLGVGSVGSMEYLRDIRDVYLPARDTLGLRVHAIGDRANQQVLDAIEILSETYKGDRRWRIEHTQIVDPADIARLGQHGVIASMQPLHQTSDRLMAEARLGPGRLAPLQRAHPRRVRQGHWRWPPGQGMCLRPPMLRSACSAR